jgi:hypothetical protein
MLRILCLIVSLLLHTAAAVGAPVSIDGTSLPAPTPGGYLTTTDGIWTWGPAASQGAGQYEISLNGIVSVGTYAVVIEVANGGHLYQKNAAGGWHEYVRPNDWVSSVPPTSVSPAAALSGRTYNKNHPHPFAGYDEFGHKVCITGHEYFMLKHYTPGWSPASQSLPLCVPYAHQ